MAPAVDAGHGRADEADEEYGDQRESLKRFNSVAAS
jgi:hypothetical protein